MTLLEFAQTIEQYPTAVQITQSAWKFPFLETVHVLNISLVVGTVAMMDLWLLGFGSTKRSFDELSRTILPWTWGAFSIAVVAGALLTWSKAATYYENTPFRLKMLCIALAGLNMIVFHFLKRHGRPWISGKPPFSARVAGVLSLCLWITVVACGRLIGFTT